MRTLCLLLCLCPIVSAQTYIVSSDNARFMDGNKVVAPVAKGTQLRITEEKDGWGKAVEPGSLKPAWVLMRQLQRRQYTDKQRKDISRLLDALETYQALRNQNSCTPTEFDRTKQWTEDIVAILGHVHPMSATCAEITGDVARNADATAAAISWYRISIERKHLVSGREAKRVGDVYIKLAHALHDAGDLTEAGRAAQSAAVVNAVHYGAESARVAESFYILGELMEDSDNEAALKYYRKAETSYAREYGDVHAETIVLRYCIANLLADMGRNAKAVKLLQVVLGHAREGNDMGDQFARKVELEIEFLKLDFEQASSVAEFRKHVDRFATEYPDDPYGRIIKLRLAESAGDLGNVAQRLDIQDSLIRELRTRVKTGLWGLSRTQQRAYLGRVGAHRFYSALTLASQLHENPKALRVSAEWLINGKGLVREAQTVQAGTLENLTKRDQWANSPYVSLEEVVKNLPKDGAFVDIVQFPSPRDANIQQYAAWITKPDGTTKYVELGSMLRLDRAIDRLRRRIMSTSDEIEEVGEIEATKKLRSDLRKVSKLLWKPIQEACGAATEIIISPDSATWIVPWSCLLNEDGTYAVESHSIELQLSGRELAQAAKSETGVTAAAIFADPAYGPASAQQSDRRGVRYALEPVERLEFSEGEANAVQPSVDRLVNRRSRLLLAEDATEKTFKALRNPEILVLSTHGFFLNPDRSAATQLHVADALQNCGLMLADANRQSAATNTNDGVLTGAEIAACNLRGTKLAVLSACQTGVGALERTGGVVGLRNAFHVAGADAVVASLWLVDDLETALIMKQFFADLATTRNVRRSVTSAQRARITARRQANGAAHPYYWAAFTLSGRAEF